MASVDRVWVELAACENTCTTKPVELPLPMGIGMNSDHIVLELDAEGSAVHDGTLQVRRSGLALATPAPTSDARLCPR